ncbi:MAG: GNAT family N-acetyltransferase [Thiohalomonadales bacterium]
MKWTQTFVELDKTTHDRPSFDCADSDLNRFLQFHAAKHMAVGVSRTMVLPGSVPLPNGKYPICAFYAIVPSSIDRESLPATLAKKLPRYPVPVFLVAQLAVHVELQGQGLGKITLVNSLEYLWQINSHMRAFAIIVDCVNESAEQFYLKYGFEILGKYKNRTRMYIPMTTVAQLFG